MSNPAASTSNQNLDDDLDWSDEEGSRIDDIFIPAPLKTTEVIRPDRRLIITKIRNRFFKSYGEETILGPFCHRLNAIVGPNGSGKSNVIDSILFVFGYRANRIRSKNLSVLLHKSNKHRNVESCSVSVHFAEIIESEDKYEILPESEFFIRRTANKDNSSFYQINDRKVHFKEISTLLNGYGIDLRNNRFLILQGEVEEISMMKPKGESENETGMLEYLEDIIGTARYKKPLDQLAERIDYMSEIRIQKLNSLQLVKNNLDKLKEPLEKAVEFLKYENKVVVCKNFLYQKNKFELEAEKQEVEEDRERVMASVEKLDGQLKELSDKKEAKTNEFKEQNAKYDGLAKKKEKLTRQFETISKKDVQYQSEMQTTNTNRKKFKQQLVDEKKKAEKLERIPEENEKLIAEYEALEQKLAGEIGQAEEKKTAIMEKIGSATQHLRDEKKELETELTELKKVVNETKAEYDLARVNLEMSMSNEEKAKDKLEKLNENIESNQQEMSDLTQQVKELDKKLPATENSLRGAKNELQTIQREQAQINQEFNKNKINLEEAQSAMQQNRSRGRILESLFQQKKEGKCPGLYGRLGDLGAIDKKYDVAISTACGPLDNIVVDTVDTAQWCIEFLRANNIGRTVFIALDKQEHLRELSNTKIRTPENVARLFDLVKVQNEDVKPAFYYALRDTLVCDTLEQASRIAYGAQRYRVVTIKGELIETSGTMSGGGRPSRGRMGQSLAADPVDVEKLEEYITSLRRKLDSFGPRERNLDNQIDVLQKEYGTMRLNYNVYTQKLKHLKQKQPELIAQLEQQKTILKSTKTDANQVKSLTQIMNAKKEQLDEATKNAEKIQVKVDKLSKEIDEKTSGKLKNVEVELKELKTRYNKCKADVTKYKVAITTSQRNLTQSRKKIENLEQNIKEAEEEILKLKASKDELVGEGEKINGWIKEITEQLTNGEEEFAELKKEVEKFTKAENDIKMKKVDVTQALKVIKDKLKSNSAISQQVQAKLDALQLNEIPDEELEELKTYTLEEIREENTEVIDLEMKSAQNAIKNAKPNLGVVDEYRKGRAVYREREKAVEEVTNKRNSLKEARDKVANQRKDEFLGAFHIIRRKLKEMYQMITLGGDADLDIADNFDPFNEGIVFTVRPPKKSWKTIMHLSGGEKTLSSLAFVFALHHYKPSPLYIMDEIDAALDFKNVSIVGHYIKERTKNSQFIIISLRENMFELATRIVGIYKVFDVTQTICLDIDAIVDADKQRENEVNEESNDVPIVPVIEENPTNMEIGAVNEA